MTGLQAGGITAPGLVGTVIACAFWTVLAAVLVHQWRCQMAMNERCRDCKRPADFRCEAREVGERRTISKAGVKQVVQPYLTFFLCADCCPKIVTGENPPRSVKALPHHRARLLEEQTAW